jgi:hypothetical protein
MPAHRADRLEEEVAALLGESWPIVGLLVVLTDHEVHPTVGSVLSVEVQVGVRDAASGVPVPSTEVEALGKIGPILEVALQVTHDLVFLDHEALADNLIDEPHQQGNSSQNHQTKSEANERQVLQICFFFFFFLSLRNRSRNFWITAQKCLPFLSVESI